jgi:hypothetical protein
MVYDNLVDGRIFAIVSAHFCLLYRWVSLIRDPIPFLMQVLYFNSLNNISSRQATLSFHARRWKVATQCREWRDSHRNRATLACHRSGSGAGDSVDDHDVYARFGRAIVRRFFLKTAPAPFK